MTPDQLKELANSGESETLEFKATTGTRREAAATVCAMLNQRGGHVLFGVTPQGASVGQSIGDRTIEDVSAEIQRIDPPAFPEIERVQVSANREVIAVRVSPGSSPPYQYRSVAYRRVGNTTRSMSATEYNRMLFERMHAEQRWENQPAAGWTVDDLDVAEIRNTVAEAVRIGRLGEPGTREPEDLLRGLGLMRDGVLFRAAAALFGKRGRLESDMPQCLLRVARFRGLDRSEFLDNRQYNGNAFVLLASAERFLRDTLPIASRFESGRMQRIDEPLYPPLATREALANALCHRDYALGGGSIGLAVYDDRLEVTSTGPLHFGLTPDDLFEPHESRPWNPLIARTFYRRGVIEEWGRGTIKMADLAASMGLPRPEIEQRGDCVTVRFRRKEEAAVRQAGRGLTRPQQAVLTLLRRSDAGLALREILPLLDEKLSNPQLRRCLAALKAKGLARSTGHGRGARWNAT
ncbi:MAG: putative DNA binding domain-containing protein [Gammaproteobacteria bacterium]|nr:putative DNA binding domain-containing protein [Gammaproteobacteria bacterium]MDE0413757.1 putative DNA binding domain-containing protein [Gammaproteobacteria bacterium]